MRKKITFTIIGICVMIIIAFFMPWVKGKGSILKPLDDVTKSAQNADFTGVTKGLIKIAKKITDASTEIVTGKKLKVTLRGFQIPLLMAKEVGVTVYLLYLVPLAGLICCWFTILGKRKKYFDAILALLAFGLFIALYKQVRVFNQEKLFVDTKASWGFYITLYSFLILSILSLVKFLIHKIANSKWLIEGENDHG